MDNIRSGNLSVEKLRQEIYERQKVLGGYYPSAKVKRLYNDAKNFLAMIQGYPYCNAKTVSELKREIKNKRAALQRELEKVDPFVPGHQFTLFEEAKELTPEEITKFEKLKETLEGEIKWLHKCLGICTNPNYFKLNAR